MSFLRERAGERMAVLLDGEEAFMVLWWVTIGIGKMGLGHKARGARCVEVRGKWKGDAGSTI